MFTSSFIPSQTEDQVDCEPEVELISLINETLPHYKLREDYSIRFSGYQHSDFYRAEQIKEQISELTNDQIHQTLEYFILCGLRVNKIMDTYEDCAALTLLVQEQRSHLDLAANIGLNLVDKNTQLEQRVMCLEKQLDESNNTMKQMSYQLALKDDLLRMFNSEIEDNEDTEGQPISQPESFDTEFSLNKVNVTHLESKLNRLEEENIKLRDQQHCITSRTDLLENKETLLVDECVTHMIESTKNIERLSFELNKKTNDYLNQHEEMSRLLIAKIDLENKTRHLLTENDNLITKVRDYQTKEFTLTKEVADMRDRYDECINLLNEKQDEIRILKRKIDKLTMQQIQSYNSSSYDRGNNQSLAMEIEDSCKRGADEIDHSRTMRIMEQARTLNTTLVDGDDETSSGFTEDFCMLSMTEAGDIIGPEQVSGNYLLRRSIQNDCERRRILRRSDTGRGNSMQPTEGSITPTLMTDSQYLSEALYHRQSSCNGFSYLNTSIITRNDSPLSSETLYRFPDKLQLVKPIEGSQTLRAWQNLATPSITKALFEDQPHDVCFRGQQFSARSSSESSPNSELSQDFNGHLGHISSDGDEDYDEHLPCVRAKETESQSVTFSYSKSKMSSPMISPSPSIHKREHVSAFSLNTHSDSAVHERRSSNSSSCTPVNDVDVASIFPTSDDIHNSPSSWLDRFAVSSIMTSILGYSPRPITSGIFTNVSHCSSTTTQSNNSASSTHTSLIDKLTHLPPLAKRKPPQSSRQSGLNLLTSLAHSSHADIAIYRVASLDCSEDQAPDHQVD